MHTCPECGLTCHCNGDIDDLLLPYDGYCNHCESADDDDNYDDYEYDNMIQESEVRGE